MGGLSDPRMGTMDRAVKCTTDGNSVLDCPGYFGHIELARPMFHVHFIKSVLKVLRCVSYHNSKLMLLPVRAGARGADGAASAGGAAHGTHRAARSPPTRRTTPSTSWRAASVARSTACACSSSTRSPSASASTRGSRSQSTAWRRGR